MGAALLHELLLRREELSGIPIQTIYFGGGTPSVLSDSDLEALLRQVYSLYPVAADAEITLEANPDDLSPARIRSLETLGINRLSIGVQSFFEDDLKLMNRAHDARQAMAAVGAAADRFANVTLDLIYGIPGSSQARWRENIERALSFGVPHISAYALTVEPRTALDAMIRAGRVAAPDEQHAHEQFSLLRTVLLEHGFIHYELSNFGKEGFFSRNNTAYWNGDPYLGIGPSAHSYDGSRRSWNVSNNSQYIQRIGFGLLPSESEILSVTDRYNEMVMTGLRTMWGISLSKVVTQFGPVYHAHLEKQAARFIENGLLEQTNGSLRATSSGLFLTDGIASALFYVE